VHNLDKILLFKPAKPLKKPEDVEHAYEYALFLLNLRMRTEAEMREKMQRRGYFPKVIDEVVERLFQDRYLDDAHYAEVYIESMKRYKYYGAFVMKKRLFEKKVPREIAEEKLRELLTENDEREIATQYIEKEFGNLEKVRKFSYEEKQKVMRRLLSRGFGIDVVKNLIT
jgi:regulatory protein